MDDLELSSSAVEYKWKGTIEIPEARTKSKTVLSEKIYFCGERTFEASFKMDEYAIYTLRLKAFVFNFSKMSFKIDQVLVSAGSLPNQRMAKDYEKGFKIEFFLPGDFLFSDLIPENSLRKGERFTTFNFELNFKIC